jgi:hypothetical protein
MDLNQDCECGNEKSYSAEYDAYYCKSCNHWLESKCDDPECEYCTKRPKVPEMRDEK